jgi:limonene-1,2-epoxide hydrolase
MRTFRLAVEANDAEAVIASLAEDVVFHSPVVFQPYRGRAAVGALLRCVMNVFRDFRYTDELASASQTALAFTARVGDREVEGIDLGAVDDRGLVTHLTVFVRPMSGATALAQAMQAELAKAGLVAR